MNKIEEVIDLLQQGVDVGDKPEGEIMQQAIDILSEPGSEPEPTEFTKEVRAAIIDNGRENSGFYDTCKCLEACDIIDSLTAENAKLKLAIDNANALIKGATMRISTLEAELKAKDEAHKNEIFKMNDICVSLCRTKDAVIEGLKRDINVISKCIGGSGTTAVACINTGMKYLVIEIAIAKTAIKELR